MASVGRGYMPPLGFLVFALVSAQLIAATGRGHLFPWSVPALAGGIAGGADGGPTPAGVPAVLVTCVAGLAGTLLWWRLADQG